MADEDVGDHVRTPTIFKTLCMSSAVLICTEYSVMSVIVDP